MGWSGRIVAALILLAVAGCTGGDSSAEDAAQGTAAITEDEQAEDEQAEEAAAGDTGRVALGGEEAAEQDPETAVEVPPLPPQQVAATSDRIIKEGTVRLEVAAGDFDRSFGAVVEAARRFGGSVVASTTRTDADGGGTFGSVTVRVPVGNYEDLLVSVGAIGTVRTRDVSAQDVSTEFVDLQARQRNLEAQERFYLGLLDRAQGVPDAIAVQQQLDDITGQLEQVKGRLAYLDERTSFSTLTVELFEPGASAPVLENEPSGAEPSLARSWQLAQDAFVNVIGTLLVVAAFLAPLLALAGAAVLVWRALRTRPGTPAPPEEMPQTSDREPSLTP